MRKNHHGIVLIGVLAMISTPHVLAGEMGPQTQANSASWQGLYIGGQLGGAWSREDWQYQNLNYFNTIGTELLGRRFGFNPSNLIGGGYLGFNYQTNSPWLLGIEGSFSGSNLSRTEPSPFYSTDRYTSSMKELGTLKGRLGYRRDQWLPYISGGWAFAKTSLTLDDHIDHVKSTTAPWNNGWVVGVGVDYKLNEHLAVGINYDYSAISINNQSMSCPGCGTGAGFGTPLVNGEFKTQTVMARISYLINQ